jgi:hypothetical protein
MGIILPHYEHFYFNEMKHKGLFVVFSKNNFTSLISFWENYINLIKNAFMGQLWSKNKVHNFASSKHDLCNSETLSMSMFGIN